MPASASDKPRFQFALFAVLRGGAILAAGFLAAGLAMYFTRGAALPLDTHPVGAASFFNGLLALDPLAYLAAGIVILIGLPIARVVLSFFYFLGERDRLYTGLTAAVLLILFVGILLGRTV